MNIIATILRWIGAVLALLILGISIASGGTAEGIGFGIIVLTLFWAPAWVFDRFSSK